MTTNAEFVSGDRSPPADPRAIPCFILPTVSAAPEVSYTFDPGDDVIATLGGGKAAFWVLAQHAGAGSRVEVCAPEPTWLDFNEAAMSKSGSGPDVTLLATDSGAYDDFDLSLRITKAGALGVATAEIAYDGSSYVESIILPVETPAVLRGTVNLTGTLPVLSGTTLVFTAPASKTITFASNYSEAEGVAAAFNALAPAQSLAVAARVHETAAGAKYIELYSTAVGVSATITVSASSTAETLLGLGTNTPTGGTAAVTLPNTGIQLVFDSGSWVADDVYTYTFIGLTASIAKQIEAAQAALASFDQHPFGYFVFPEQASQIAAVTLAGAMHTLCATAAADPDAPRFVDFVIGTKLHAASPSKATNDTGIAANDADFLSATAGQSASMFRNFAHDDCYIEAAAGLPAGKFRRSAALAASIRRASLDRIAGNPGQYVIPLVSLLGPDGLTRARNEASATTKLGRKTGRAWCLKSVNNQLGLVKFDVSPTGAGASSRFWDPGVVALSFSLATAACAVVQEWEGESWETDPESPAAVLPEFADARANELAQALDDIAKPKNKPPNISGNLHVVVSAPTLLNDGDVLAEVTFNPLGVPQSITIRITATGAVIQEAA